MFVSVAQQSHLVIHIYIYIYFKNILFYIMVYPRILGIVPWLNSRILLFIHSIFFFFCNTQEGLLSVEQTGDSDLLGGRAHRTANWASFL